MMRMCWSAYHVNCCGINIVIILNYKIEWALCLCVSAPFNQQTTNAHKEIEEKAK